MADDEEIWMWWKLKKKLSPPHRWSETSLLSIPRMRYYYAEKMVIVEEFFFRMRKLNLLNNKNLFSTKRLLTTHPLSLMLEGCELDEIQWDLKSLACTWTAHSRLSSVMTRVRVGRGKKSFNVSRELQFLEYHRHSSNRTCLRIGPYGEMGINL